MIAAGIDIGSNTILMTIVEGSAHHILQVIQDVQSFPRLGQGMGHDRILQPDAVERSCAVLARYRQMLQAYPESSVYAVATAALREADNRLDVQSRLEAALEGPIDVIDGIREAELTFAGVRQTIGDGGDGTCIVIDIGGGSTEFVLGQSLGAAHQVHHRWSVPIGAVRLSDYQLPLAELRRVIRAALDEHLPHGIISGGHQVIGVAGTAVAAAMLAGGVTAYDAALIDGMVLATERIEEISTMLHSYTTEQLLALPGIEPRRADILPAGMAILDEALSYVQATSLRISTRGVRYGAALVGLQANSSVS